MTWHDPIGYVDTENGGPYTCPDCATPKERQEWSAIFEGSETDCPSHCDRCEALIPESLTGDGARYVLAALLDFLNASPDERKAGGAGRREILAAWWDEYRDTLTGAIGHALRPPPPARRTCATCGEEESSPPWEGTHKYGPTTHPFVPRSPNP